MNLELNDKNVIITGGANGLGKQIALCFADEGASICICDLEKEQKEAQRWLANVKKKTGVNTFFFPCDLSNRAAVQKLIKQAENELGKIDILVNNAGIWPASARVADIEQEQWDITIEVNLNAVYVLCKNMIKSLLERKAEGKIINIVSDVAFYGSLSGHADYAASKGGVVAFSHSIAREYANMGININCVAPGFMSTKMTREILAKDKNAVCHRIPINRIADPKEIADVVVFLGSKRASYITASTVNVTGGLLIR